MKKRQQTRKFICESQDLPGWVWVWSNGLNYLIPASRAQEEGLIP